MLVGSCLEIDIVTFCTFVSCDCVRKNDLICVSNILL